MTRYYIGFAASTKLSEEARNLLEQRGKVPNMALMDPLVRVVDLFVPDVLDNMLLRCCDAIGIGPTASKIVHTGVDTINAAVNMLIPQLMKKRSEEEIVAMVAFVDRIFLRANQASTGLDSAGAEVSQKDFEEMKFVTKEIQAGRAAQVMPQLHRIMIEVADVVMDRFMKDPLNELKLNFVMRKICDGTMATCKGAAHMIINRVFKRLDDEELKRMSTYFDGLLISAEGK